MGGCWGWARGWIGVLWCWAWGLGMRSDMGGMIVIGYICGIWDMDILLMDKMLRYFIEGK